MFVLISTLVAVRSLSVETISGPAVNHGKCCDRYVGISEVMRMDERWREKKLYIADMRWQ